VRSLTSIYEVCKGWVLPLIDFVNNFTKKTPQYDYCGANNLKTKKQPLASLRAT